MSNRLNGHLKTSQINTLKMLLEEEQRRILENVEKKKTEYSRALETRNIEDVDLANNDILLSTNMRFSNRELLYLKKIKKSLLKVDTEEFGMCGECGNIISYQRLKARPTCELCITCKEESEAEENQSYYQRQSKSLGQAVRV